MFVVAQSTNKGRTRALKKELCGDMAAYDISVDDLSQMTGMAKSTLYRRLKNPAQLQLQEYWIIRDALDHEKLKFEKQH